MQVRKEAISGVKWTTLATVSTAICAILKISILARFLETSDFGLMALVTFVLGFMDLFMDMGLTSAILYKQDISKNEYNSLYWLNVVFSLLLFFGILSLSPIVASFYGEPQLKKLLPLMGVAIIFSAFGRQFKTILHKELEFKTISLIEIIAVICSLVLAVIMAIKGFGVYSLVLSALLQYFLSNALFFFIGIRRKPLGFYFNYGITKPFLKIGIYQVGGQFINYFNRDLDVLIIGKFFGTELLGGYSLAKQLVRRPLMIVDPIMTKVAISIMPRFQNDSKVLLGYFSKLIKGMALVDALIYGGMAICAPVLVQIFYGETYADIVPFVRIFASIVYFRSLGGVTGILAITKGRTDLEFYWNLITLIIFPIVILVGANIGILQILIFIAITQLLMTFPVWYMFYHKILNMGLKEYVVSIFAPFLVASILVSGFILTAQEGQNVIIQVLASLVLAAGLLIFATLSNSEYLEYFKILLAKYVKSSYRDRH